MRYVHEMPFGARALADGGARFRLWAPGVSQVELCVLGNAGERRETMLPAADGWFALDYDSVPVGSRYCFRMPDGLKVPDPASRFQPQDVHGPSELIAPDAYEWRDDAWRGRPWEETVLYELHVGSFAPEGTFGGVQRRLDYLAGLGVTAIELMPVSDFPGARNWGYDGVLPYAPDSHYGRPEDLKALVDAAHARGLMVFLDVVYNHFGPEGNYLHVYARQFFTERHHTPWGAAINFDGEGSRTVRDFFIHNALYWLEEYHVDGLRFDAVHAIIDDSAPDILEELADVVQAGPGKQRHIHLVLENDHNEAHYLRRDGGEAHRYVAQWNDDIHHALHALLTGEHEGYYTDYADAPARHLGRCLAEGFAYQGDASRYRDGAPRGEPSAHLPPTAFVSFLQNHDQIGNRAFGDRIATLASPEALRAVYAILLLAPSPPLLFMGEEWGARVPFPFFCDFGPDLAAAVTRGRREEFARFPAFSDPAVRQRIPDPNEPATFSSAALDWSNTGSAESESWLGYVRELLGLRQREIVPRLVGMPGGRAVFSVIGERGLQVSWSLNDGSELVLQANLGAAPLSGTNMPKGERLFATVSSRSSVLPPWSVYWYRRAAR
jgi:maltooligosyltrehalose trehalohydrolase